MLRVVRVEFAGPGRHQYSPAPGFTLRGGDIVVVETDWGVGMGHVGSILEDLPLDSLKPTVRRILRKATPTDLSRRAALAQREREVRVFCQERIQVRGLPMKLTEVRIGLDSSKAMFYFTADGRVDFRELVKDLVQEFRTRIELRQIGVRHRAKMVGGLGICGRGLCCAGFLRDFEPVSVRMAKEQQLSLNPNKISGICGRLMCCLTYEYASYQELRKSLPKVGKRLQAPEGEGKIIRYNFIRETVTLEMEDRREVEYSLTELGIGDAAPVAPAEPDSEA